MQFILINVIAVVILDALRGLGVEEMFRGWWEGWPFVQNLKLPGDQRRALNKKSIK